MRSCFLRVLSDEVLFRSPRHRIHFVVLSLISLSLGDPCVANALDPRVLDADGPSGRENRGISGSFRFVVRRQNLTEREGTLLILKAVKLTVR